MSRYGLCSYEHFNRGHQTAICNQPEHMGEVIRVIINRTYFRVKGGSANNYTGITGITQNDLGKLACVLILDKRNKD